MSETHLELGLRPRDQEKRNALLRELLAERLADAVGAAIVPRIAGAT